MIAIYGDNCIDRYVRPSPADFVGGNAVNVAVHLADLGAEVAYFGILGDDSEGVRIRQALVARDISCSHVETRQGQTAVTLIEVRDGERFVLDDNVGIQCPLTLAEESWNALGPYLFVHCTAFTSWNVEWRRACPKIVKEVEFLGRAGKHVSLDFSELAEPELASLLGRFLTVAFVSRGVRCSNAELEDTFRFFHGCGVPEVIVTMGVRGSAYSGGGQKPRVPAIPIEPVDTLGAGDAYIASWLFRRSRGGDPRSCMQEATALATQVCGYWGAWPSEKKSGTNMLR